MELHRRLNLTVELQALKSLQRSMSNRISYHASKTLDMKQLTDSIKSIKPLASGINGLELTAG